MYDSKKLNFGISGIYKIQNMQTGQLYVGSAKCLRKRFNDHANKLRKDKHPNQYLQHVYNKHGSEVFQTKLVEEVSDLQQLTTVEQKYLDKFYDNQQNCYNICPTAGNALGRKHTRETKEKISRAHKGKTILPSTRKKHSENAKKNIKHHFKTGPGNPMFGRTKDLHRNAAAVLKICNLTNNVLATFPTLKEAAMGVGKTKRTSYANISAVIRGDRRTAYGFIWKLVKSQHPWTGKQHSEKSKKKMSLSSRGVPNHKNGKAVAQYSLAGDLIEIFTTQAEAGRKTGIIGIRSCASGIRKSAGGFMWRCDDNKIIPRKIKPYIPKEMKKYTQLKQETIEKIRNSHPKRKQVKQINKFTNDIIKVYSSTKEAERQVGISNSHISSCARGLRKTAGGFIWKYVELDKSR